MAKNDEVKKIDEVKKVDEVKPADKVEKVEPKPIVAKAKYVKVIPKVNGKRFIGGTWYHLVKDKEIEVTEDAKRSLKQAGAIYL
jgi:hypothetical protein